MIFVDTGFLFALASNKDPNHERVREVFETFDPKRLPDLWLRRIMRSLNRSLL